MQLDWGGYTPVALTGHKSVCLVVSSFEGLFINSGIGTAYHGLAELLVRNGYNVTVLYTRDTPTLHGSFSDWVARYKQQNITLKYLPPSTIRIANPKLQTTSLQVYRYLKANPFDIVHFADFEGLGYYSTLAKHNGLAFDTTTFVAGLHGPTRWILEANTGRSPAHESELEVDWMERLSVEYADYVWTPSSYLASWLSMQGWNFSSEVQLLPLPPGPEMHQITVEPITRTQPKEIVYFGRLEKRKGLLLFCDALDILSKMTGLLPQNLTVTFLGTSGFVDGQNSSDYVRARTASWPFHVNIISDASRAASLRYLTEAGTSRLPVIPSLVDNAPYTVFECLYAGIPFLASATPSIIPLLANGTAQNEHLFDTKPHNLASRLVTAFKSGVAPASSVYSIVQAEQAWLSFYNSMKPTSAVAPVATTPLVSVIITHFNRPNLVRQAIQSIEAQDYTNYEVILADDGSNDTSAIQYLKSIQEYFVQKNWKIIQTGNKYLGAARNAAARVAQGKYLLFLDDDNTAHPSQLSTYVKAASKTNANILTSAHAIFRGFQPPVPEKAERYWVPLGASLTVGLFKNCFGDANFFVDKESFFAVGGFTEEYGVGLEDHEFFAKAVFAGQKLAVIPEPLLYYRMHDEQSQMLFASDPRMGEARRIRPYLAALAPESASSVEEDEEENDASRIRRSVVTLVARNALDVQEDCNQTLSSVSPSTGPVSGGTLITINGVGFSCGVTAVQVDNNACTGVQILSNTQLSCTTPKGSRVYVATDITATVGGSTVTLYQAFTYLPLGAPQLASCIVQDSGTGITCKWDTPTNQNSGASCSSVFTPDTSSKFGSNWRCIWESNSIMDIYLGSGATIDFTDNITAVASAITSQGEGGLPNQLTSVPLQRPLNPVKPVVSILAPAIVGGCEGVTLDATGSTGNAGRPFTVVDWQLVFASPNSNEDLLTQSFSTANTAKSLTIEVDNSTLNVNSTYMFALNFTNWLNQTGSTTITIRKSNLSVPKVSISGASVRSLTRDIPLTLQSTVTASCGASLGSITYLWSFSPAVSGLDPSTLTSATLTVPANTFKAGTIYTGTLTVTDADSGLTNSANVTVVVNIRDLVVVLTGGSQQYHTSDVITLNATGSYDPEDLGPLSFAWSCVSFHDSTQTCNVNLPTDGIVTVNADTLGVGKWTFEVTVSGGDARSASASAWVEVLETVVISISISGPTGDVDPFGNVTLRGLLNSATVSINDLTWNWTLTQGSIADSEGAYLSPLTERILVIAGGYLTQGVQYTYQLTATYPATGATGVAEFSFTVAKSTSGELACPVGSGEAESTQFTYVFERTAAVQDYEITYTYADVAVNIPVAEPSTNNQISTLLPAGSLAITGFILSATDGSVQGKFNCSATATFSNPSDGVSTLVAATSQTLSAFDVARIAFSARSTYKDNSVDVSNVFGGLISRLQSVVSSSASQASTTASTAALFAISDPQIWTLSNSQLETILGITTPLLSAQLAHISTIDQAVIQLDLNILDNLIQQINKQTGSSSKRAAMLTQTDAYQQVVTIIQRIANMLSATSEAGQNELDINGNGADISFKKVSGTSGASIGPSSGVVMSLPANSLPSDASLVWVRFAASPYPVDPNTTIASRVMIISALTSSGALALDATALSVRVPNSQLQSSPYYECQMYNDNSWTTVGVTTSQDNSGVTCSYPQQATAFAVVATANNPNPKSDSTGKSKGGLSGGAIAGIAIGGAAALAIAVGAAFGVRKFRGEGGAAAGPAIPAAGAPPAVSNVPAVVAAVPVGSPAAIAPVNTNLTDVAVEPQVRGLPVVPAAAAVTPAVAGPSGLQTSPSAASTYSNGTRSYAGSSSSSEEEIMEQEIKNIVGELTHALPRDSRALEVLGDKLEME